MKKSESIAHISTALVNFQDDLEPVHKNSTVQVKTKTGGSYSFAYATLDEILKTSRPVLKKHGLAFSQFVEDGGLTTILVHESGEWMEAHTSFDGIQYHSAQELGSAITYLRRYALTAALGISADEDDDGNVNAGNSYQRASKKNGAATKTSSHNLTRDIMEAAERTYGDEKNKRLRELTNGITKGRTSLVKDMTQQEAQFLLDGIKSKGEQSEMLYNPDYDE